MYPLKKISFSFGVTLILILLSFLSANATSLEPYINKGNNEVCLHKGGAISVTFCQVLPGTGRCLDIPILATEEQAIRKAFQLKQGEMPHTLDSRLQAFFEKGIRIGHNIICTNNNRF